MRFYLTMARFVTRNGPLRTSAFDACNLSASAAKWVIPAIWGMELPAIGIRGSTLRLEESGYVVHSEKSPGMMRVVTMFRIREKERIVITAGLGKGEDDSHGWFPGRATGAQAVARA